MIYFVLSCLLIFFIYANVFGMWKGFKDIPEGEYKEKIWKYKKMEIFEKGIITLLFIAVIIAMKFTEEVAMISLIIMAVMLIIENFFGKYIRKNLTCPHCGGPLWAGNYIVLQRPRKYCPHCSKPLVEEQNNEEEQ